MFFPQEVEKDGIRFPSDLDTPYAVAQVLNQQPGKLRIKDIRDAVMAKKSKDESGMTKQMKVCIIYRRWNHLSHNIGAVIPKQLVDDHSID